MNHISKYFSALAGLALSAASVLCVSGCEDKIEAEGPKDLYEVIVNKPVVRIGQNETVEVRIGFRRCGDHHQRFEERRHHSDRDGR